MENGEGVCGQWVGGREGGILSPFPAFCGLVDFGRDDCAMRLSVLPDISGIMTLLSQIMGRLKFIVCSGVKAVIPIIHEAPSYCH